MNFRSEPIFGIQCSVLLNLPVLGLEPICLVLVLFGSLVGEELKKELASLLLMWFLIHPAKPQKTEFVKEAENEQFFPQNTAVHFEVDDVFCSLVLCDLS